MYQKSFATRVPWQSLLHSFQKVIEQPNLKRLEVTSCPSWVLEYMAMFIFLHTYMRYHGRELFSNMELIWWLFGDSILPPWFTNLGVLVWWHRDEIYPDSQILLGFPPAYHNSPLKHHPFMELLSWLKFWNKPCAEECWKISFFYLHVLADSCRFLHLEFWECNLTRVTTSIQKKT